MELGKNKKKYIINAAIIIIVASLTFFYLFRSKVITAESLSAIKWYFYLICIAAFVAIISILAVAERFIYGTFTDELNYKRSLFTVIFGNFGSGITPFRSGHFPLKAYYQYKDGVVVGTTVTGFLKCQIIYSAVSLALYAAVTVALAVTGLSVVISGTDVKLWIVAAVGFGFHAAVFIGVIILAFSERLQRGALKLVCKIAKKFKKEFDGEGFYSAQSEKLARFKEQIRIVGKSFYKYLLPAALYAVYTVASGCLPYLAYLLLSGKGFAFSDLFFFYVLSLTSVYITNVIPLPGGTGTAEMLFILVFSSVISDPLLGETLVLWRISTYYLPITVEFLLFLPVSLKKRRVQPQIQ